MTLLAVLGNGNKRGKKSPDMITLTVIITSVFGSIGVAYLIAYITGGREGIEILNEAIVWAFRK